MGNRLIITAISLLLFISCLGQGLYSEGVYKDGYIYISEIEYSSLIDNNKVELLNGSYYIVNFDKSITIKRFKNGIKTGEWLTFQSTYSGRRLTSVENYEKGELDGYFFSSDYHTQTQQGYYKNGKKHGVWTIENFAYGDDVLTQGNYKNGKKHGDWLIEETTEYGEIETKGVYKNGRKHDLWITKDSTLLDLNNKPYTTKEYYKNGLLIKKE